MSVSELTGDELSSAGFADTGSTCDDQVLLMVLELMFKGMFQLYLSPLVVIQKVDITVQVFTELIVLRLDAVSEQSKMTSMGLEMGEFFRFKGKIGEDYFLSI